MTLNERKPEICLVVYRRWQRVPYIIDQLKRQTFHDFTLNIWDNSRQLVDNKLFPSWVKVVNSKENVGSQARFRLARITIGNPIIFIDDDQVLEKDFIEHLLTEFDRYGASAILGSHTRIFKEGLYWDGELGEAGKEVDYVGTAGMILDRGIIDRESSLTNIPEDFRLVEDLYLSYIARMKYNMTLRKIESRSHMVKDGLDQCRSIDKDGAFSKLVSMGWRLLKDAS